MFKNKKIFFYFVFVLNIIFFIKSADFQPMDEKGNSNYIQKKKLIREGRLIKNPKTPGFSYRSKLISKVWNRSKIIKASQKKIPSASAISDDECAQYFDSEKESGNFKFKYLNGDGIIIKTIIVKNLSGQEFECQCECKIHTPLNKHMIGHSEQFMKERGDMIECEYCKIPFYITKTKYDFHCNTYHRDEK